MPGVGGPGTADSLLALALARAGHRVEVLVAPGREIVPLALEWEERYAASGVAVHRLAHDPGIRPRFLEPTAVVYRRLRADPPEVVVADDWRGLAFAALRARQVGLALADTAFVLYTHGPARVLAEAARKVPDTIDRFGEAVVQRHCLELADAVVSPSEWLLDWMGARGWPVPATAHVIQNLWESAVTGEPPSQAKSGGRVRRLAFFGQLREGKGTRVFADALRGLDSRRLHDVELLFLGRETPRWNEARMREALGPEVLEHVSSIRFERALERAAALTELRSEGTLAVMPSLLENSPYAVAECIEHGIPFVGSRVGGVPELVAEEDRERVLCPPTAHALRDALEQALASSDGFAPARPARPPEESVAAWLDLVEAVVPARPHSVAPAEHVEVIASGSRRDGLARTTAEWVVFLDDEDVPDDGFVDVLVAAQAVSNADVVTTAVRRGDETHLFLGDAMSLGLVENQYGVVGLIRASLAREYVFDDAAVDPDWPLFARATLSGARIVSIPEPVVTHRGRVGTIADVPGEGIAVLEAFEAHTPSDLAELAATAASCAQQTNCGANVANHHRLRRFAGVVRRLKAR